VGAIRGHAGMIAREAPSAHVIRTDLPPSVRTLVPMVERSRRSWWARTRQAH
jgi:hypothetical protein